MPNTLQRIALGIGLAIFVAVVALRWLGLLEPVEVAAYDRLVRAHTGATAPGPITLIRIHEEDIRRFGHPIPDKLLAEFVQRLLAGGPRAVGVDLYRDRPEPRRSLPHDPTPPAHYARLGELVTGAPQVVMVMKLPGPRGVGTPPPSFLPDASQVGLSDVPLDAGRFARRGLLYAARDGSIHTSFALQLALRHLAADDITPVPDPIYPDRLRLGLTTFAPFRANDGPYARGDAGGYQILLDFSDGPGAFPTYSLAQLSSGAVPESDVRGRIVILGTSAPSVKDTFSTPIGSISGIELHAHAASQLMRQARLGGAPLMSLPEWAEGLWILIWSLLGARLGLWNRSVSVTLGVTAAGLAALAFLGWGLFAAGWFLPVVPPALAGLASAGIVTSLVAVVERRERTQVRRLFSRFLRPTVADEIWRQRALFMAEGERGRPRSQLITTTTLISDLKGYTAASEEMGPETLMEWINEYMDVMADLIERCGGVVDDYAGDGIKASFGFPVASETEEAIDDDAVHAVQCALQMGAAIEQLNRGWAARGLPTGRVRIGILTGPVVAGSVGSASSLKYTTVGDSVNTAARLESFDKDGFGAQDDAPSWRVLIGEETRRRVGDRFETRDLGRHRLPGKSHELEIHQVFKLVSALVLALLLGFGVAAPRAHAEDDEPEPQRADEAKPEQTEDAEPPNRFTFTPPPDMGAPAQTEGGATRGGAQAGPRVRVVAPGGVGETLEAQPVLYWHLSRTSFERVYLVIYETETLATIVDGELRGPFLAGLQRVRLTDLGGTLAPGTVYEWTVRLGTGRRFARGRVRRIYAPERLHEQLDGAVGADKAVALAASGVWYDAFASLSRRVDAEPDDAMRHAERRNLMRAAGVDTDMAR